MTADALALWHDFFLMVGGGAAALTGLVFVAMSLNLGVISQDATHRYRAIGTLTGFAAVFVTCALVLMGGQDHRAVGAEWAGIALVAGVVYVNGYVQAIRQHGTASARGPVRVIFGTSFYVIEVVGAVLLAFGLVAGIYAAALSMIALLAWGVSGAWLLLIVVYRQIAEQ